MREGKGRRRKGGGKEEIGREGGREGGGRDGEGDGEGDREGERIISWAMYHFFRQNSKRSIKRERDQDGREGRRRCRQTERERETGRKGVEEKRESKGGENGASKIVDRVCAREKCEVEEGGQAGEQVCTSRSLREQK
jgi:hypothetical protein